MKGFTSGLVLVGFILIQIQGTVCINCLKCENIADLSNCQKVITCQDNEVCYIEKFLSSDFIPLYNTGCRSIEFCTLQFCNKKEYGDGNSRKKRQSGGEVLTLCSECCFEDSCNTQGCGYIPHLKNISQCYNCDRVSKDGPPCTKTVDCDLKLFSCSVTLSTGFTAEYDLGCTYKRKQCAYLLALNDEQQDENVKCCDTPLCNKNPYHRKINKTAIAKNFTCPAGIARPTATPSPATTFIANSTFTSSKTNTTKTPTSSPPMGTNASSTSTDAITTAKSTSVPTTSVPTTPVQVTTSIPTTTAQVTTPIQTTTAQVTTSAPTTPAQITTPVPTTPAQVTTPVPTTTTIAAKSTEPPLKTLPPVTTTCAVCSGPKFLCEKLFAPTPCPPPNNYCINTIQNHKDGTKTVDRACGNFDTCYREWFLGSSDKDKCRRFKGNIEQRLDFQCTFCCTTDNCNIPLHPDINTLYQPS